MMTEGSTTDSIKIQPYYKGEVPRYETVGSKMEGEIIIIIISLNHMTDTYLL
tara:strand:+ start:100 stop:255 length:156 start_codon:yes stop_codon:yes gene_type:complete